MAGVSAKTVSRVVNRDDHVSEETRRRVEAAIEKTGYRINLAARALAATRSYLIGTFMPDFSSYYFHEAFRGATNACRQYGYHLVVEEFVLNAETLIDRYEQGLRAARCDALMLLPPTCDDIRLLDALDRDGVPYVRLFPAIEPERSIALFTDDRLGVHQLVEHLWRAGKRHFAIIAGPADHAATALRETAFLEKIAALGGDPAAVAIARPTWHPPIGSVGREATAALLESGQRIDAIFAFNDEAALGALGCVREKGYVVPDDIAIAGFDDSYIAQLTWPPLTTVHQPIAALAARAIELIAEPRAVETLPDAYCLPTHLIVRGSA